MEEMPHQEESNYDEEEMLRRAMEESLKEQQVKNTRVVQPTSHVQAHDDDLDDEIMR